MRKTKRILCGVSAAALVFGSMSCYVASATSASSDKTLANNTQQLENGTYKLTAPLTMQNTITVPSGVTAVIDLNGQTLTGCNSTTIKVEGNLTIKDSSTGGKIVGNNSTDSNYCIWVTKTGNLTWESGDFEDNATIGSSGRKSSIGVNAGTLTINGGTFSSNNDTWLININSSGGVWTGNLSIKNAKLTSENCKLHGVLHLATSNAVTIADSKIDGEVYIDAVNNNDGEFKLTNTDMKGKLYSVSDDNSKKSVTFDKDCTFDGDLSFKASNHNTITFNGGEVTIDKVTLNENTAENVLTFGEDVTLTLSEDAKTALTDCIPEGYELVKNAEGKYVKGYKVTTGADIKNGEVTVSPETVAEGDTVTVTVKPEEGYELDELTVNNGDVTTTEGEDGTYTFEMPAEDVTVSATFKEITYNVTVDTTTNGKVTLSSESAVKDEEVTVTVKPDAGYELNTLTVTDKDGKDVTTTKTTDGCKFNMPEGGATVKATFKKSETPTYTVTVSEEDKNGTVEVTPENAPAGDTVAVKVTPAEGYELDTLTVTDEKGNEIETTVTSDGYSFKMPEGKVTVTAAFKEKKAEDSGSSGSSSSGSSGSTTTPTTPSTEEFPDEESGVVATADEGVVPDGAELTVTPVADETDGTKVTLDICFKDGKGVEVQPNGKVTVKVPVPTVFKEASKVYVYREETNGTYTDMKAEVKDGLVVFTTDHFSKYVITTEQIKTNAPAADNDKADNTTPGANPNTGIALGLAPVLLAGTVTVVCARRKK